MTPSKKQPPQPAAEQVADETLAVELDVGKMVVFDMETQRYAIPIDSVQEIQQIVEFSDVPVADPVAVGLMNLRGNVIAALDMRRILGLAPHEFHVDTPMIICRTQGQLVALIVDEVEDVMDLPSGCLAPPPRMHALKERMLGVCRMENGLVYLLDIDRLLAPIDLPGGGG